MKPRHQNRYPKSIIKDYQVLLNNDTVIYQEPFITYNKDSLDWLMYFGYVKESDISDLAIRDSTIVNQKRVSHRGTVMNPFSSTGISYQ